MESLVKKYLAAELVSRRSAYTIRVLGQICQVGLLDAKSIGRRWFISEEDVKSKLETRKLTPFITSLRRFQKLRLGLGLLAGFLLLTTGLFFGFELKAQGNLPKKEKGLQSFTWAGWSKNWALTWERSTPWFLFPAKG